MLVTEDAPSYGVLAGLRALRAAGYQPWLAAVGRDGYSRRSRARAGLVEVPDPALDPGRYVAALARAAEELRVLAVLPGTEVGMVALAGTASAFPPGVALGAPERDTVARATDKLELARLAADAGLATPPTLRTTLAEAQSAAARVDLPAIVKAPRTSTPTKTGGLAAAHVMRVSTREQLLEAIRSLPGDLALIQPALEGELVAASGVAWCGEVVAIVHQVARRIFPPGCGISAYAETVPGDPALEDGVRRLIGELGWSGIFQAQFVASGGTSYLIDLNPRIYGSMALAVAAGLNLPAIWADLLLGRPPRIGAYRPGVRFRSEERDLAALGAATLTGDWRTALGVLRPRRHTTHAVAALRDPLPLLTSGRRLVRARRALGSARG